MRIVIVGAGGLGGFYGGLLARSGADVTFLVRSETLKALQANGLTVTSKLAGNFTIPVKAVDRLEPDSPPDLIFFSVKAYDLEPAARSIAHLIGPNTSVLAVQNGIEHPDRLGEILRREAIVPGVVLVSATILQPGVIDQIGGPGSIAIGELEKRGDGRLDRIAETLKTAGIPIEIHDDIWSHLWWKFMVICAMSGVTALTRLILRQIFDVSESRDFYRDVMVEVAAVARAAGANVSESAPGEVMDTLLSTPTLPERGSMAYDLLAGRRLELDTLNGAVVRLGRQYGIETPLNRVITAALLPYCDGSPG
jgi:2-dehydropantoate 2-reductase